MTSMVFILLTFYTILPVESVVPTTLPSSGRDTTRNEWITHYFKDGLKYFEIVLMLFRRHNIKISIRHLKRILRNLGLRRRVQHYASTEDVKETIKQECKVSGQCLGYRTMWKRLVRDHGLVVKRNTVMNLLKEIDPGATESRKAHKLRRRIYTLKGPNYAWHVDGYDKLKPFGFCIHGCIDGYSRKIMWLEVASSNNNPAVIAKYYLDCLLDVKFAPRILRADYGTENTSLSFLQPLFRYSSNDSLSGINSFIYGKSTSNQRIESWWGILRRLGIHWWINLFKDIRDCGIFDIDNPVVKDCMRFCFMKALQTDLDRIALQWNSHDIRSQKRYTELPTGKPNIMFFVPELTDGRNFGTRVDTKDVKECIKLYGKQKEICSKEFKEIVDIINPGVEVPVHPHNALQLFADLYRHLENYI